MLPRIAHPRLCAVSLNFRSRMTGAAAALLMLLGLANAQAYAATYALSVSSSSGHGSAIALNGATLTGNEYVFTSLASALTNFDPTGIAKVCYWLDNTAMSGTATHCESFVPYDFAGSVNNTPGSPGNPWNTTRVANSSHTITQRVTLSAGGTEVDTATFTVKNGVQSGSVYALSVSASATHSGGVALQGATLAGNAYIFTSLASALTNFDPTGISTVCYWLDNTAMSGAATHCDSAVPYDFAGSASSSTADPWNTALVSNGTHTITQLVTKSAGGTEVDAASFSIQNLTATLSASPTNITSGQSSTLTWTTSGATSASIDQGIGTVALSGMFGVSPKVTTTYTLTATGAGGGSSTPSATVSVGTVTTQHYLYVAPDQNLYVFDLDNNFQEVKHINIPQAQGVRGMAAAVSSHTLYIAYGGDGLVCDHPGCAIYSNTGSLLAYDLLTDTVAWTNSYSFAVDSFSITPDGKTIYMPDGEHSGNGIWYVLDASDGTKLSSINTGMNGPHNTIVSLDGAEVFMGPAFSSSLVEASTSSNAVTLDIGPLMSGNDIGVRPFTINGKHTLALTTARNYLGFQVSDTGTGKVLYTVPVPGFPTTGSSSIPSHGISLSPDETRLYLLDNWDDYVHVFDVSGLPSTAPTLLKSLHLTRSFSGNVTPCLYDCYREGWLNHSSDGRYVFVGDAGNVIDTGTNQLITVPGALSGPLSNTKMYLEIDWQNGVPVSTPTRYGLGFVTK